MGTPGPDPDGPDGRGGHQSGQSAPPTCFRHPGRETYVSCVRCGRPACPDCLRSAAVGQQCVECIRQGNRGTRQAAGVFGGGAMLGVAISGGRVIGVAGGQWYRLITAAFLPPPGLGGLGPLDIVFNMWALIFVGPALERMLGRARFLTVYLVSALGGSVLFYYLAPVNEP